MKMVINLLDLVLLIEKKQTLSFQDDDDDDFSGPAIGGPVGVRSDSDDEDEPPTMSNIRSQFRSSLTVPNKKPFSMEVIDF